MVSRRGRIDVSELPLAVYAWLSKVKKPSKKRQERQERKGKNWQTITVERQIRICQKRAKENKVPL